MPKICRSKKSLTLCNLFYFLISATKTFAGQISPGACPTKFNAVLSGASSEGKMCQRRGHHESWCVQLLNVSVQQRLGRGHELYHSEAKNDLIFLCSCSNNIRYVSGHCDFCPAKCLLDNVVTYPFECSTHDFAPGKCRVYSRN